MSEAKARELAAQNTDRELWREREGDYYADSIHVTASGGIGINCGGHVIVRSLCEWHNLAAFPAPPAEPRVPREPTMEMQRAMIGAMFDEDHSDLKFREFAKIVRKGWRAAYDAAPAAAPVAQPRNSSLPATAEDKTIYDRIAANYAAPVAQRRPRELLAEIQLARQEGYQNGLSEGWKQGRANALEEIETERAANAAVDEPVAQQPPPMRDD